MRIWKLVEYFFLPELRRYGKFTHIKEQDFILPETKRIGLYLHIPFCLSLCPYCPYDRILFEKTLSERYTNAVIKEIKLIKDKVGRVEITSLYIGGGTPTTIGKNLEKIVTKIKDEFLLKENTIFIETNPNDITEEKVAMLKDLGTGMVSIGVQSFQDKFLRAIGRNYDAKTAMNAIEIVKKYINNVNIDLMFALPEQSEKDFEYDLKKAIKAEVQQITGYPLFTFPYSQVGKFLKINSVKLPSFNSRKRMFYLMYNMLTKNGFVPASVWGFKKPDGAEFSSVSRMYYIGIGASAATKVPGKFYMNTFSIPHYIKRINSGQCAEVVKMDFTRRMDDYYWLYWKIYETRFQKSEFEKRFHSDRKARLLIKILETGNFIKIKGAHYTLTRKGMFYVHLLQNRIALNHIGKAWGKMMQNPEPHEIQI